MYIGSTDAWVAYKVGVVRGGYANLVQYPAVKNISYVDWPELNGIDPDLSAPKLSAKTNVSMNFFCANSPSGTDSFCSCFEPDSDLTLVPIGLTLPLRFKNISSRNRVRTLELFTANFSLDSVSVEDWEDYANCSAETTDPGVETQASGLTIDGDDISTYGIMPLKGASTAIDSPSSLKDNLIINSDTIDGILYPDTEVVKSSRTVSIPLLLRASSKSRFWPNYLALLNTLVTPGEHILGYGGASHYFYYQNQSVTTFHVYADGAVWCMFNLSLMFYKG